MDSCEGDEEKAKVLLNTLRKKSYFSSKFEMKNSDTTDEDPVKLLQRGMKTRDENYELPIDHVWKNKDYKLVLSLLEMGSPYPSEFDYLALLRMLGSDETAKEKQEDLRKLILFYRKPLKLQECRPIDDKWTNEEYETVLEWLKKGSPFPRNFNVESLDEQDEDFDPCVNIIKIRFKKFVKNRNILHQSILNSDLEKVKELTKNKLWDNFYNSKNQSAACTAIKNRDFKIYDHLKSIDADFDEEELDFENKENENYIFLDEAERFVVREIKSNYLQSDYNDYKSYLYSMSRYEPKSGTLNQVRGKYIREIFDKLSEVPEISVIMKVVAKASNLKIDFDFDNDTIRKLCLENALGITFFEEKSIVIAAKKWSEKKGKKEILGTVGHEFAHLAMFLVFKNNCRPYSKSDNSNKKKFQKLKNQLLEVSKSLKKGSKKCYTPSNTFSGAFKYYERKVESELIARVPDILAEFKSAGRQFLEGKKVKGLFQFFKNHVILECEKFLKENYQFAKMRIEDFNRSKGEIEKIKKINVSFKNIGNLKVLNNYQNNKIYLLYSTSTTLSLIRILEEKYGENYFENCGEYLILSFENCINNLEKVKREFYSIPCDVLVIECNSNFIGSDKKISDIFRFNTKNKQIFFVANKNNCDHLENIVTTLPENIQAKFNAVADKDFSLLDLKFNSQKKILGKFVEFQGQKIKLGDLFKGKGGSNKDKEGLDMLVNPEIMGKLLIGDRVELVSKPTGANSLEGIYTDVSNEINEKALKEEINKSNGIFIFSNMDIKDLITNFKKLKVKKNNWLSVKEFKAIPEKIGKEIIFYSNRLITIDEFKSFCSYKPEKRIYLIIKNEENKLFVKHLYNPEFHSNRNLLKKIILKMDKVDNFKNDLFFIGISDPMSFNDIKKDNIRWLKHETAETEYMNHESGNGENKHLIKFEKGKFIWRKSSGSLQNLRCLISEKDFFRIEKDDFIKEMKNEKTVMILDDSGIGATSTVVKLYESHMLNTHWVLFLKLSDHTEAISNIDSNNLNMENLVDFLVKVDFNLKRDLCKEFLRLALKDKFSKRLLIVVDGFHEINTDQDKVASLLKYISKNTKAKLWVITQLPFKELLEKNLSTFAIEFEPIDTENFIKDYFKSRTKLILKTIDFEAAFGKGNEIQDGLDYAKKLIDKMEFMFKKNFEKFIRNPYYLHLILENSVQSFVNWVENNKKDPDFSFLKEGTNNVLKVLERCFYKKYDDYFNKNGIQRAIELGYMDIVMKFHENYYNELAFALMRNTNLPEIPEPHRTQLLSVGILNLIHGKLEFNHFTFKEYFFAQSFIKCLINFGDYKQNKDQLQNLIKDIFFKKKGRYELTRSLIDSKLEVLGEDYKGALSDLISDSLREEVTEWLKSLYIYLCDAIEENQYQIFNVFFSSKLSDSDYVNLLEINNTFKVNFINKNLLHRAAESGNENTWDLIISKYEYLAGKNIINEEITEYFKRKTLNEALDLAAKNGHFEIVEKIINKIPESDLLSFVCLNPEIENNGYSSLSLKLAIDRGYVDIVRFLLETIIKLSSGEKKLEIFRTSSAYFNKRNLFQIAAHGCCEIFDLIFTKAEEIKFSISNENTDYLKNELNKMICSKDSAGHDALYYAVLSNKLDIVDFILLKVKRLRLDYCSDNFKKSFYLAVEKGHVKIVQSIFKNADKWVNNMLFKKETYGTVLHLAAVSDNLILEAIIEKAKEKLPKHGSPKTFFNFLKQTDEWGHTVLHLIAMANHCEMYMSVLKNLDPLDDEAIKNSNLISVFANTLLNYEKSFIFLKNVHHFIFIKEKLNNSDQFEELLRMKNKLDHTVLHLSCMLQNTEVIKWVGVSENLDWRKLYELLCEDDVYKMRALHWAILMGRHQIVQYLGKKIDKNVDKEEQLNFLCKPNVSGQTMFDLAKDSDSFLKTKNIFKKFNIVEQEGGQIDVKIKNLTTSDNV